MDHWCFKHDDDRENQFDCKWIQNFDDAETNKTKLECDGKG